MKAAIDVVGHWLQAANQYNGFIALILFMLLIVIAYRRGGTGTLNIGALALTVGVPASNKRLTVHYPVLMRAVRDIAALIHSKSMGNLGDVYKDLLIGASQCGRGKQPCRVALMVPHGPELVCKEIYKHSQEAKANWRFSLQKISPASKAFTDQTMYNCPDVKKDKIWKPLPGQKRDAYRSFVCVPVVLSGSSLGLLIVDSPVVGAFRQDAEEELTSYADALAFLLSLEYHEAGGARQ